MVQLSLAWQSLSRPNALRSLPEFDLIVIDEAHHVTAETYRKVIDCVTKNNSNAKIFGVTATPMRGDKNNIGVIFSNCADIEHASNVTDAFQKAGIAAELVTSLMDKEAREQALYDLETGKIQVLVNVAILTEG